MALNQGPLSIANLNKYVKGLIAPDVQKSVVLSMAIAKKRVAYKFSANKLKKLVYYKHMTPEPIAGAHSTSFPQDNPYFELEFDVAAWHLGASIDLITRLKSQNASETRWIDVVDEQVKRMKDSVMHFLRGAPWCKADTTRYKNFLGFPTFQAYTASSNITGTGLMTVDGTYGGKPTDFGTFVPTWSASLDFPNVAADDLRPFGYYCMSPWIVDYQDTDVIAAELTSGTRYNRWSKTAQYALNYITSIFAALHNRRFDICVMEWNMFRQMCDSFIGSQTLEVTNQNSDAVKLGHTVRTYRGTEIIEEFGLPAGEAFLWCWDKVEFHSLLSQLIESLGPEDDIVTDDHLNKVLSSLQMIHETPTYTGRLVGDTALQA